MTADLELPSKAPEFRQLLGLLIDHVVDKLQQLQHEIAHRHFLLFTEVDHFAVQAIAHRPPLVLLNQHTAIKPEPKVLVDEFVELAFYAQFALLNVNFNFPHRRVFLCKRMVVQ